LPSLLTGRSSAPSADSTIFEIGSLSKLFTSLLLAVATTRKEVGLDDPVQTVLGEQVTLPTDGKSQITYRSLANHRSSLPRLPGDLILAADMQNPYAHYDQEMLYACLNRMKSVKPIGSRQAYSNFGVGLLGHALGKLAGSDYRAALQQRALIPLGMRNTSTQACDEQTAQLATAHKRKNKPTKHWDFTEATAAAGGVRSSLADMLKFLRANVYPEESGLGDELALMRETSQLPQCEAGRGQYPFLLWCRAIADFAIVAVCMPIIFGKPWLTQIGPNGLLHLSIMLLPTFGATIHWRSIGGAVTFLLMMFLTWWLWGPTPFWGAELIWAVIGIKHLSTQNLRGDGRLAWQSSVVSRHGPIVGALCGRWLGGLHPILWHNGMVGGSASYLGIVPEMEIGVVVLTNTAKSVDAIGVKILSEMVKLKENDLREQKHD
jgi:CubicO group peptidase (beta-lactamase class C family)